MVHASLLKTFVLYGFPLSAVALPAANYRRNTAIVKRQLGAVSGVTNLVSFFFLKLWYLYMLSTSRLPCNRSTPRQRNLQL